HQRYVLADDLLRVGRQILELEARRVPLGATGARPASDRGDLLDLAAHRQREAKLDGLAHGDLLVCDELQAADRYFLDPPAYRVPARRDVRGGRVGRPRVAPGL